MYKHSLTIALLSFAACGLQAQTDRKIDANAGEKAEIPVYFRFDSDMVDSEYKDNAKSISTARRLINDNTIKVDSMTMVATASPEGSVTYNRGLALRRATSMQNYFAAEFPRLADNISTSIKLYSWSDLATSIAADENVPHLNAVLDALNRNANHPRIMDIIRRIDGGQALGYIEENYLSKMRSAANCLVYYIPRVEPEPEPEPVVVVEEVDTTPKYREVKYRYPVFAFRSNLLVPLANIGVILPLGNRFSVAADWYSPWIFRRSNHKNCFQFQMANAEVRYWLGSKHTSDPDNRQYRLTGHSLAAYIYGGKYDFERDYSGHQGEFWSAGIDYTYAIPACNNRLRWEFSISAGYLRNQSYAYDVFTEGGKLYTRSADRKVVRYVGPTKVAVSLVIPINKCYTKLIKEEER